MFRKYVGETQLLAKNDLSADFVKNSMFEVLFVRLNIEFSEFSAKMNSNQRIFKSAISCPITW